MFPVHEPRLPLLSNLFANYYFEPQVHYFLLAHHSSLSPTGIFQASTCCFQFSVAVNPPKLAEVKLSQVQLIALKMHFLQTVHL